MHCMTLTVFSLFLAYIHTHTYTAPDDDDSLFFLFPTLQMADCKDPPCPLSPHQYARSLQ